MFFVNVCAWAFITSIGGATAYAGVKAGYQLWWRRRGERAFHASQERAARNDRF